MSAPTEPGYVREGRATEMGVAGGTCVLRGLVLPAWAGFVRALACVVKAGWCAHVTWRRGLFLSRGGVGEEGWGVCREACACESGICTYVHTHEETGGNVQAGRWARGKGCMRVCRRGRGRQRALRADRGRPRAPHRGVGAGGSQGSPVRDYTQAVPGRIRRSGRFPVPGSVGKGAMRCVCVQGQERLCKRRDGTCPSVASP